LTKRFISVSLLLVLMFTLSGCSLFAGKTTKKTMPSDTQVLEEVTEGKVDSTVTKEDEDQLELKHLKNAKPAVEKNTATQADTAVSTGSQEQTTSADSMVSSAPVNSPVSYKPDYRIHFLSEEEAKVANEKLIKLGYLKAPAKDAKEFTDAVCHFQQDEKITGSGDINPETFERLRNK